MKDDVIMVEGEVIENLPNTLFKVKLLNSDKVILCYLSGKMRKNYIKILPGDKIRAEITPYDLNRGELFIEYEDIIINKKNVCQVQDGKKKGQTLCCLQQC